MFKTLITLFLVGCVLVTPSHGQGCSTITLSRDVCLFNVSGSYNGGGTLPLCESANENPFNTRSYTGSVDVTADQCGDAVRQNGNMCIQLYAEFQCSAYCSTCVQKPCFKFCDSIATTCPIAYELGCFQDGPLSVVCASESNNNCVDWNVNKNKLPSSLHATTTTGTGTTTTHTTDMTSAGSRSQDNLFLIVGILALSFLLNV